MKVLVLGASGATGKLVVKELIDRGIQARIVIRESASLPSEIVESGNVEVIKGSIYDFEVGKIKELLSGSDVVISCLGTT